MFEFEGYTIDLDTVQAVGAVRKNSPALMNYSFDVYLIGNTLNILGRLEKGRWKGIGRPELEQALKENAIDCRARFVDIWEEHKDRATVNYEAIPEEIKIEFK